MFLVGSTSSPISLAFPPSRQTLTMGFYSVWRWMDYENLTNYEQHLMAKQYIEGTKPQRIKVVLQKFWVDVFALAESRDSEIGGPSC